MLSVIPVQRPQIQMASDPELLGDIYRFRYRIYVEEMGRIQYHADHHRKRIVDSLDDSGYNLVALKNAEIVGVVRVNFSRDRTIDFYDEFYGMASVGADHPQYTSTSTRLMVAPEYRGTTLAVRLSVACYKLALDNEIRWNFIDCNDHLVPFFAGLGYLPHRGRVNHPEYGFVNSMILPLGNIGHLNAVKSPFAKVFQDASRAAAASPVVAASAKDHTARGLAARRTK
jgi:GNAT superfamily N-acetyltransferase